MTLTMRRSFERPMDVLTEFGLFAVSAMLICYAFEARSAWWVLGFAIACARGDQSTASLQGAWLFGGVEAIGCLIALNRWRVRQWPRSRSPG